jgi:hypothetical protein
VGHNDEAAPRVCVPANVVSGLIFLLGVIANKRTVQFKTAIQAIVNKYIIQ